MAGFSTLFFFLFSFFTSVYSLTYKGIDWSSVLAEEKSGASFSSASGVKEPLEKILAASGVNTVRQRIWVTDGDYGLNYNIAIAKRAHAAGLKIFLDFHYSSTWADPGHQATPSAWAGQAVGPLKGAIYNYTLNAMNAFAAAGVPISIVSIGNEINNGMVEPVGSINNAANLAAILHSAAYGVKDSKQGGSAKIAIHLADGWSYSAQSYWYDKVLAAGDLVSSDFSVQAVSYYPFYNTAATLASLKSSLSSMKSKYGKEIMVVETNWPTACPNPAYAFPADARNIPFSVAGQVTWIKDVAQIVASVGGTGLFVWEPAYLKDPPLGSSCTNNLMFTAQGQALSSLSVFGSI